MSENDKSDLWWGIGVALVILAMGGCTLMESYAAKIDAETKAIREHK